MSKIYVFDLDGTLCKEGKTFERPLAIPKKDMIGIVNNLYENGNMIIIYTARSWAEYRITEHWLNTNGVNYNLLMCGKITYDYWIDDRAINSSNIKKIRSKLW
jgi:hydroxymethylpyrimidine pyrophosphatase-like HAD family hydrolase